MRRKLPSKHVVGLDEPGLEAVRGWFMQWDLTDVKQDNLNVLQELLRRHDFSAPIMLTVAKKKKNSYLPC
ncbi:hypothetical protein HYALB_00003582 [Hymenoscyphus albidus]|uniref:Uncharacterized protein n=1 Tax=Hymenoscyphus albidus TaxID=595503 RepID=A0A9N9LXW3_9HELO|nr:hypothetical protein HYALB_00003582 [Hymenoscyphus albidus]